MTGRVVDANNGAVAGAVVTCLDKTTTSGTGGEFSITGLPTITRDIICAAKVTVAGIDLTGASARVEPARGATTHVGDIIVIETKGFVSAGAYHTCAITLTRGVKCWGQNIDGQLGDGTFVSSSSPRDVKDLTDVVALSAGGQHTCALTSLGAVKCWGLNVNGRLGDGTVVKRSTPTDVVGLTSGVKQVSAGSATTCAVLASGALQCWGSNQNGQVGDGTITDRLTPTNVAGLSSGVMAVTTGGLLRVQF